MQWIWILLGIFAFLVLLIIGLDTVISLMYRIKSKPHKVNLNKQKFPIEEIHIPVNKKGNLYGWWIPGNQNAPTLILVHGWGRNLDRMTPYIRKLHPQGYNLLAFDARSHGSSSTVKRPTVGTFSEDVLAALNYVTKTKDDAQQDIGVIGLSIGGAAAINAASMDKRIKSVITVGAFAHPVEAMKVEFQKRHVPAFIPSLLFLYMHLRFGFDFDKLAPMNNIRKAEANIFLIHGDKDEVVPVIQGITLKEASNQKKTRLWIVPDKGHSNCETHPDFWNKVTEYLKETLPIP